MATLEPEVALLEAEVEEMGARIAELRSNGPARFRALVDEQLWQLRPRLDVPPSPAPNPNDQETPSNEIASMRAKLSAALEQLPLLLGRVQRCTLELDSKLARKCRVDDKPPPYVQLFEALQPEDLSSIPSSQQLMQLLAE